MILFLGVSFCLAQTEEKLTITTYYPSPFGMYKEMRSQRQAIGDNYYKSSDYCWDGICSTHISSNTDLIVEGDVGIGMVDPRAKLHVNGRIKAFDPVDDDDVATKAYVDAQVSGPGSWDCIVASGEYPGTYRGVTGRIRWYSSTASCPAGYTLITGGCDWIAGDPTHYVRISDSPTTNGWFCAITQTNELRARAWCCK